MKHLIRLLLLGSLAAGLRDATAAALVVSNANDSGTGSLRQTVVDATSGDTLTFDAALSGVVLTLTSGPIPLDESLTIDASTLPDGFCVNGNANGRLFEVGSGTTNVLDSLTLSNGVAGVTNGGGAILNAGDLTLSRCTLTGNTAGLGGAIANAGALTLNQCTLAGNFVANRLIALWTFENSMPAATNAGMTALTNVVAEVGVGTASGWHTNAATYSSPVGNGSSRSFSVNGWSVGDYFRFEVSTAGQSNLFVNFDQTGSATGPQDFRLSYSTDGVVFMTFTNYAVLGNGTSPNPGWNAASPSAAYSYAFDLSAVTALNNTTVVFAVENVSTTSLNGGTVAAGGTARIDNFSVVAGGGNGSGGAIYNTGTLRVNQSTLSANTASVSGGGICHFTGTLSVSNSLVAGNTAPVGANYHGVAAFSGINLTNGNPRLAALGRYGGPTPTRPPLAGEPAIDGCTNGSDFATDQRGAGFARIVDGDGNGSVVADVGAVETVPAPLVVTGPVTGASNTVATLNGTANPRGTPATAWIEWGDGVAYDHQTVPVALGSGTNAVALSTNLTGLTPGVLYRVRVVATNLVDVVHGAELRFGSPVLLLNSAATVTQVAGTTFTDPTSAYCAPLALATHGSHNLALRSDRTVFAWGYNIDGQTNVPVGLTNVVAIAGGGRHSLALRGSGTVAAWGYSLDGQTNVPAGLGNVVEIAAGSLHSLALRSDGTVVAWGWNYYGQTNVPAGLSNVVAIACGDLHSLALRSDGTVVAWGLDNHGQTDVPAALVDVVEIAGGENHSLALRSDGRVAVWGRNNFGQTNVPAGLSNIVAIAGCENHSLALRGNGTVIAWGDNGYGQTNVPVGLTSVVAIAAGSGYSVALRSDGSAVAWGNDSHGQTTVPPGVQALPFTVSGSVDVNTPGTYGLTYTSANALGGIGTAMRTVVVVLGPTVIAAASTATTSNTVATLNGMVNPGGTPTVAWFEWGTGWDYPHQTTPVALGGGTNAVALATNLAGLTPGLVYHYRLVASNALAVVRGGEVLFGSPAIALNGGAVVTNDIGTAYTDPATAFGAPLAVSGGREHFLALRNDRTVFGWGANGSDETTPPPGLTQATAVAAGSYYSIAVSTDGTAVAWGFSNVGQTNVPSGLSNVAAVAAGGGHGLALRHDGTVAAWGWGYFGQTNVPPGLGNVVAVAAGGDFSLALRGDGTVSAWGDNSAGKTSFPSGLSNVVALAAGAGHALAVRRDGSVVAWGDNFVGYTNDFFGPTNVPSGLSNVVAVAAGGEHSLTLRRDGTVVAWGLNDDGQTNVPSGLSNVVAIAAAGNTSLALRRDGTILAWGDNDFGQTNIPADVYLLPVTVSGSVDIFTVGSYVLTYTSSNALGGISTATRTVVVVPVAPGAITSYYSPVNDTTATLNGLVNPGGTNAVAYFEFGTDTNYGLVSGVTNLAPGFSYLPVALELSGLLTGTTYHYRLVASNSVGVAYGYDFMLFTLGPAPTPFQLWRALHFSTNLVTGAWNANPDNDGLNNLQEYAFGSLPTNGASLVQPEVGITNNHLSITVPRNTNATDVTWWVEHSYDLLSWTTLTNVSATNPPAPATLTVQSTNVLGTHPTEVLRVKVTLP